MEFQEIIKKVKQLVADGDIKAALDALYDFVSKYRKEFEKECLLLKAQLSASQNKQMLGLVYAETLSVSFNSLTYGLLELLDKMEDAESQKKVETVKAGRGLLMHNIPRLMPIDTKTRCTIRIGALKEELLKNFKTTTDTAIEEIKVTMVMKVTMESMVGDIFEIHTVNSSEQYADLDTYSEWRYDVVPRQIGEFPLALVVASLQFIDAKERVYEQVFEVVINITTVEHYLNSKPERYWDEVAIVQNNLFSGNFCCVDEKISDIDISENVNDTKLDPSFIDKVDVNSMPTVLPAYKFTFSILTAIVALIAIIVLTAIYISSC